jgi:peptide/nickel transport system ATP-binding protein
MVLRRHPQLLVADEPTTAVDATHRGRILTLLVEHCRELGCALLLLTHDLNAVAEHADRIAVMYGGRVVESGSAADVLADPLHPYTRALLGALPGEEKFGQRLTAIPGLPPVLRGAAPGCAFAPRCPSALSRCATTRPAHVPIGHRDIACHLYPQSSGEAGPPDASRQQDTASTASSPSGEDR